MLCELRSGHFGGVGPRGGVALATLLQESRPGWRIGWRAWAPRYDPGYLDSGFSNVPNLVLVDIDPAPLLTGAVVRAAFYWQQDQDGETGEMIRVPVLEKAPEEGEPEAILFAFGWSPGWGTGVFGPPDSELVWGWTSPNCHGGVLLIPRAGG